MAVVPTWQGFPRWERRCGPGQALLTAPERRRCSYFTDQEAETQKVQQLCTSTRLLAKKGTEAIQERI